jgi:hypothetical protein
LNKVNTVEMLRISSLSREEIFYNVNWKINKYNIQQLKFKNSWDEVNGRMKMVKIQLFGFR